MKCQSLFLYCCNKSMGNQKLCICCGREKGQGQGGWRENLVSLTPSKNKPFMYLPLHAQSITITSYRIINKVLEFSLLIHIRIYSLSFILLKLLHNNLETNVVIIEDILFKISILKSKTYSLLHFLSIKSNH